MSYVKVMFHTPQSHPNRTNLPCACGDAVTYNPYRIGCRIKQKTRRVEK
jgi:hypothetical protein